MASSFITGIATGDMRRAFANDGAVVMASHTGCSTDDIMIKVRRYKGGGTMTAFTLITAGSHMPDVFADNRGVIVAAVTGGGEEGVVYPRRNPGRSAEMAIVAGILTDDMAGAFAGGARAIMARGTGGRDVSVIEARRFPGNGAMTLVADITALEVVRGFPGGLQAIMAVETGGGHSHVIHACVGPADFGMAVIAVITAFDVIGGLPGGPDQAGRAMTTLAA